MGTKYGYVRPHDGGEVIKLPTFAGIEIIPLRLIPLVTDPMLTPRYLLEHLWNPRGEFFPALVAQNIPGSDWTVIDQVMRPDMDLESQIAQFPAGAYVSRTDFENYDQFADEVKLSLNKIIPVPLLKFVFEGFEYPVESDREPVANIPPRIPSATDPRTYTRNEVADFLGTTMEVVFNMMTGKYKNPSNGKQEVKLNPSIIRNIPTKMHKSNDPLIDELKGVFGIDGYELVWGEDGSALVAFGGRNRVLLYQGEFTYMVSEPFEIHKDELVVTAEDLDGYRRQTRRWELKFPHDMQDPEQKEQPKKLQPKQLDRTNKFKALSSFYHSAIKDYRVPKEPPGTSLEYPDWDAFYEFIRNRQQQNEKPKYFNGIIINKVISDSEICITTPDKLYKKIDCRKRYNTLVKELRNNSRQLPP